MKYYFLIAISVLYLLNFTLGVWEVPDNLPIIGHVDELAASGLLIYSLQAIRKKRIAKKEQAAEPSDGENEPK